jgi:hypothetical protein
VIEKVDKAMDKTKNTQRWTDQLSDEDLAFLKRFVLASGSLKDLATAYGISYPTVRLRLDRLIDKVKLYDSQEITSEFERTLRVHFAEGKLDAETFKSLLAAHNHEMEGSGHDTNRGAAESAGERGRTGG